MVETSKKRSDASVVRYFPALLPAAAVIGALIQILAKGSPVAETLLVWLLAVGGLGGIWSYFGHWFRSDDVARSIGWPPGSGFQKEIALTNLAFGALGIMCIWFRGDFWLAVITGHSIFLFGAAYNHIKDRYKNNNKAPGNWGPILWLGDIAMPVIMILLYIFYRW